MTPYYLDSNLVLIDKTDAQAMQIFLQAANALENAVVLGGEPLDFELVKRGDGNFSIILIFAVQDEGAALTALDALGDFIGNVVVPDPNVTYEKLQSTTSRPRRPVFDT